MEGLLRLGPFDAVINCAAISQPGVCEQSPDAARCVTARRSVATTPVHGRL